MKKSLLFVLLVSVLLTACGHKTVYSEYKKMDNVSWNRFNFLLFEVPVNAGDELDIDLALRHHTYFPYDYLDVNITFYLPNGGMRTAEYHFELKDENGNWKANGMGELWDIELPIRDKLYFDKTGICKVRIENKMTKMETPGILEVGLLAKRSE